jgi:hypothetical protein
MVIFDSHAHIVLIAAGIIAERNERIGCVGKEIGEIGFSAQPNNLSVRAGSMLGYSTRAVTACWNSLSENAWLSRMYNNSDGAGLLM